MGNWECHNSNHASQRLGYAVKDEVTYEAIIYGLREYQLPSLDRRL